MTTTQLKYSKYIFRTTFSVRTKLGLRRKFLNKRTKQINKFVLPPYLIIDIDYIELLIKKKLYSKHSNISKHKISDIELLNLWLKKALDISLPKNIIFIAAEKTEFNTKISYPIIYTDIVSYVYNIKIQNLLPNPLVLFSNNITLWSLASKEANLSFLALNTNDRLLYYNNSTGLDILSKFIGTYKIINKLGLHHLKYINLQYLYILLFYIKYSTSIKNSEFYFDGTYYRQSSKIKLPFLKSHGSGLSLIADAHKFLSYAFLTKPEYLDYFLLGNADHFEIHLQRLQKLLVMDKQILLAFKIRFDQAVPRKLVPINIPLIAPELPDTNNRYYNMLLAEKNVCNTFYDTKRLAALLKKYINTYGINCPFTSVINTLPSSFQKELNNILLRATNTAISNSSEIESDNDLDSYVSNLISEIF